jgi:hypothetical protein
MQKFIAVVGLLIFSVGAYAQTYVKPYVGINFGQRILSSSYPVRKDSLDRADKIKVFPAVGVQFLFENTPGREFYIGLGYMENGFVRERFDYQFQDTVHADLGRILDLSHAAQKNAYFAYHFKYLEMPLGFNFQVTPRQYMNIFTGWFNVGVNPQLLIKQNMIINLEGFTMKGENRFDLENTGYEAAKFNVSLQAGGRFDYSINKKNWVTADALFKMHLLHTAESPNEKLRVYTFSVNLGMKHEIGK